MMLIYFFPTTYRQAPPIDQPRHSARQDSFRWLEIDIAGNSLETVLQMGFETTPPAPFSP